MSLAFGSPGRQLRGTIKLPYNECEVHLAFKFSRAELIHMENPYTQGLYLARPEQTFEQAYRWADEHASLHSWMDVLYKNAQLPEVNLVVSGMAVHPALPSKYHENLGPWVDSSYEKTNRPGGDMDLLQHMSVQKTTVVIQGDRLHGASQIVYMNGHDSFQSTLKDVKEELTRRAVRLTKLNEILQEHPQVPSDAMETWLGTVLRENDVRGMSVDLYKLGKQFAHEYLVTQEMDPKLTPEQLKYGTMVKVAGDIMQLQFFKSDKAIYHDIMEYGISGLEDANRDAHYAQLTRENVLADVLNRCPAEAREAYTNAWNAIEPEVTTAYPDASPQWQTVTIAIRALQEVEELVPQDTRYDIFHNLDLESRFVDSMEGKEHEAITPFD